MNKEQIVTWLLEFGSDYVDVDILQGTWVWGSIALNRSLRDGWLDVRFDGDDNHYKLSTKAIDFIKEK